VMQQLLAVDPQFNGQTEAGLGLDESVGLRPTDSDSTHRQYRLQVHFIRIAYQVPYTVQLKHLVISSANA
jgi:hypothetical protein